MKSAIVAVAAVVAVVVWTLPVGGAGAGVVTSAGGASGENPVWPWSLSRFRERFAKRVGAAHTRQQRRAALDLQSRAEAFAAAAALVKTLNDGIAHDVTAWWGLEAPASVSRAQLDAAHAAEVAGDEEMRRTGLDPFHINPVRFAAVREHLSPQHQQQIEARIATQQPQRPRPAAARAARAASSSSDTDAYDAYDALAELSAHAQAQVGTAAGTGVRAAATQKEQCDEIYDFCWNEKNSGRAGTCAVVTGSRGHVTGLGKFNPQISQAEHDDAWAVWRHRVAAFGWTKGTVCNALAVEKGLNGVLMTHTPDSMVTDGFRMGIEEELCDVALAPDTPDEFGVEGFIVSGTVAARNSVPYLKVCPDHSRWANGKSGPILELALGPMAMTWDNRNLHRKVCDTFSSVLPAPGGSNKFGTVKTLQEQVTAFNGHVDVNLMGAPLHDFKLDTGLYRGDIARVVEDDTHKIYKPRIAKMKNPNCEYHNIQINFECSLCAIAEGNAFLGLHEDVNTIQMLRAFRAAAKNLFVNDRFGAYDGVKIATYNSLSPQQQCELVGLLTVWYGHTFFWGIRNRMDPQEGHTNLLPIATARPKYWGGHYKNIFSVMIKTSVHKIVPKLPYPLSDVVASLVAAWEAHKDAVEKILHDTFIAAATPLWTHSAILTEYLSFIKEEVSTWGGFSSEIRDSNKPWLIASGANGWIRGYFQAFYFKQESGVNPVNTSPIRGRSPKAYVYRNTGAANHQQVVVVAEARYQYAAINRAFTSEPVCAVSYFGKWKAHPAQSIIHDSCSALYIEQLKLVPSLPKAAVGNPVAIP